MICFRLQVSKNHSSLTKERFIFMTKREVQREVDQKRNKETKICLALLFQVSLALLFALKVISELVYLQESNMRALNSWQE